MSCAKEKASTRVSKAEYETLAAFRYNLRQFLRFSESAAESAGLTSRQHQALLAIKGFPARDCVTVGELAEQLLLRRKGQNGVEGGGLFFFNFDLHLGHPCLRRLVDLYGISK